jgi:ADP-ribosylglycohydrolase
MSRKAEAMVLASFAGDSLALGPHWIYDVEEIERRFGRVEQFMKPSPDSYHPSKEAGEFTHYGDQTLVLLESIAEAGGFDLQDFARRWRRLFSDYRGYFDHATKDTLRNFQEGRGPEDSGALSTDLAGASRVAPLVYRYRRDSGALVTAAKAQTAMTHNHPVVVQSAEFLVRAALAILEGEAPTAAMTKVADTSFKDGFVATAVHEALESLSLSAREAVLGFGQSCNTRGALPAVVFLVAKHESDLKEALVQNAMAGGDSAARGMAVGMLLGAHLGIDGIPGDWVSGMKASPQIHDLLARIDKSLGE